MNVLFAILISFVILLAMDFAWINFLSKRFYLKSFKQFGRIEKGRWKIKIVPAILSWIFIILGITVFAQAYAFNPLSAFFSGALFGFITYGIYDLTNLATIKKWSIKLTIIDLLWGTMLCGVVNLILFSLI